MKSRFNGVKSGLTALSVISFSVWAWASDNPPVPPVPGQTAITSPTPQPTAPESTITSQTPPTPGVQARDRNGVPSLVVEFATDHYDIPPAFHPQLNAFGQYLKQHPESTAELNGHADNSGHGPANGALSQKRANAVFAYLVNHYGIAANRIKAEGYGVTTDKASNSTGASKQAERSVYGTIQNAKS